MRAPGGSGQPGACASGGPLRPPLTVRPAQGCDRPLFATGPSHLKHKGAADSWTGANMGTLVVRGGVRLYVNVPMRSTGPASW